MKTIFAIIQILAIMFNGAAPAEPPPSHSPGEIRTIYKDKNFFLSVIKQTESYTGESYQNVTGITVPHHLLAKDLLAETFQKISTNKYKTIILLSPDHFNRGTTPFSTTAKSFETVFGAPETDKNLVQKILNENDLLTESDLFNREHGIHAVTPFIKHHFPNATLIPIAIRIDSTREELDSLYKTLIQNIHTSSTLIVQSTDFSHYLPKPEADQKDNETIAVIKTKDPAQIMLLHQPNNIDSRGAQYLQSRLQNEFFASDLARIQAVNSEEYSTDTVNETTSYITQIYKK